MDIKTENRIKTILGLSQAQPLPTDWEIQNNTFAAACYDQNSVDELIAGVNQSRADRTDCSAWQITPRVWRRSIAGALLARLSLNV